MPNPTARLFQERRQRFIRISLVIGAILLASFLSMIAVNSLGVRVEMALFGLAAFVLSVIIWILVTFRLYRCPACNEVPLRNNGRVHVDFNPASCRKCGASFR